jgi:hypothetical protein
MRLRDWKARLTAYLSHCARQPYQVGVLDCALFAAGAVEAVQGTDPSAAWRGRYSTKAGGLRLLRRAGFADHIAATAAVLQPIAPAMAAAGDIAVLDVQGARSLGVVQGEVVFVLRATGLGHMPRSAMQGAFRT